MLVAILRCSVLMRPSIIEDALAMHIIVKKTLPYLDRHALSYTLEYGHRTDPHLASTRTFRETPRKIIFSCRVVKSFAKMRNGYRL